MTVLEVGIIADGLPVFIIDYKLEIKGDITLRSGLFSAIHSFAKYAFGDETEELRLKSLIICMITLNLQGFDLILFAVSDKKTKSIEPIRSALTKIGVRLMNHKQNIHTMDISKNEYLRPIFEDEFKNLRMRPIDRIKGMFG